ncbi:MAG: chitobiase/beta-hexosaminidase C-terminal domain-containing protein [Phycisphaera sp.]|nr:MAG: chitobiase/beta-hexosaminidase C-terminal domain-containing protein [Phycisphaera sp.]
MNSIIRAAAGMAVAIASTLGHAQDQVENTRPDPADIDLTEPTLFVVGYAHLDTQWRWTYHDTIREFIPNTLHHNFDRFEKYPGYVFNFGGTRRFRMMEEYYPEDFETLKKHVAEGRWFPSGSAVDENDANVPSGESQIRHVLYGNKYTRDTFGVTSSEFMLPDCFGFPAALPSLLAHSGLKGFSTQKLTWNAVTPIPFKVGVWEGPDGNSIIAALDPGAYVADVRTDLSKDESWFQRINNNGEESGVYVDYHYYGVGDQGGAPREPSVALVEQSVANSKNKDAKINVIAQRADMMFEAITPEQRAALPTYTGELQLIEHSAGSISSQAYMKRWNRKNEQLADAAEKAAVGAMLLGARDYPGQRLQDAWELVLGSQMHDILPGTSVPLAYDLSWNDEVIAANQFGAVLADSASAIIGAMDTTAQGTSVIVFNPLSWDRHDLVEAEIPFEGEAPKAVVVLNAEGEPVPAQVLWADDHGVARIAFTGTVPSIGFAAFDVRLSQNEFPGRSSELSITPDGRRLENGNYIVKLNARGDVESIFDKQADTELLSAPARIGLHYENPSQWPAWNMDWADRQLPAKAFVGESGPVSVEVIENGPARVAVQVTREAEGSTFTQRIRLASGGQRVEFDTDIDWKTRERSVRTAFPLTASNPTATYDIHLGTTERGNGHPNQYEYLFHQWFDLTDTSGDFGTTVMCDSKYAADKPDDSTVRLTLLFTPGVRGGYPDQQSQDIGRHHVLYAVQGHAGDWREGRSFANAAGLNQPLIPFRTTSHAGDLGKSVSLLSLSSDTVSVQAMKKAEDTGEIVIRLREQSGQAANNISIGSDLGMISGARLVDGQERALADLTINNGAIETDIGSYGLQAIALTIDEVATRASKPESRPVRLRYNTDAISTNADRTAGGMASGRSYPAEQLPPALTLGGVEFQLGEADENNAMACRGQELQLPMGDFDTLYLLLASSDDDAHAFVSINGDEHYLGAPAWDGYVGQWDHREWPGDVTDPRYPWGRSDIIGLTPGFIKPDEIAWYASHHHSGGEDAIYRYCYVFRKSIELAEGTRTVTLPDDPRIKILAASVARVGATAEPARALFDTLDDHQQRPPVIEVAGVPTGRNGAYTDTIEATIEPSLYWQPGSFHYTTDGSKPTTDSPVYSGAITLTETTTISTAAVDTQGTLGPAQTRTVRVVDETCPSVRSVLAMYEMPQIRVEFSEPVKQLGPGNFELDPSIAVRRVEMDNDFRAATIDLASAPEMGTPYTLLTRAVQDRSPAGNGLDTHRQTFVISGPVFSLETIDKSQYGSTIENTPGLPVNAGDPWTINVWAKMEGQPTNHTVLVGFGNCDARNGGQARYLTKFASGVHMWSHNQDVPSRTQYDTGRWQMITATYDGRVGKLYKDGKLIGQRTVRLSDDANLIQIAPLDPWDRRYQFGGDLAGLTIWDQALTEQAIDTLLDSSPR